MNHQTDRAVERHTLRPLPHHLCRACNPARRRPFVGVCPGCSTDHRERAQ